MKQLVAAAFMALALYGVITGGATAADDPNQVLAHHNSQHSQGPCGPTPCSPRAGA
jgi:hypothetical protein